MPDSGAPYLTSLITERELSSTAIAISKEGYRRTSVSYYLYVDRQGLWHWYLMTSADAHIAMSSESYRSEEECRRAIALVKESAAAPTLVVAMQP